MPETFNPDMLILARQYRALSQGELAEKVKGILNQPRLSRIENGLYSPTTEELEALARALSVRTEFLFHPMTRRSTSARSKALWRGTSPNGPATESLSAQPPQFWRRPVTHKKTGPNMNNVKIVAGSFLVPMFP